MSAKNVKKIAVAKKSDKVRRPELWKGLPAGAGPGARVVYSGGNVNRKVWLKKGATLTAKSGWRNFHGAPYLQVEASNGKRFFLAPGNVEIRAALKSAKVAVARATEVLKIQKVAKAEVAAK